MFWRKKNKAAAISTPLPIHSGAPHQSNGLITASPKSTPQKTGSAKDIANRPAGEVRFDYFAPEAKAVFLAGDFNAWSPTSLPLKRDSSGRWEVMLTLSSGSYQYKFIVDSNWVVDHRPTALIDNPFGSKNSVIRI